MHAAVWWHVCILYSNTVSLINYYVRTGIPVSLCIDLGTRNSYVSYS